MTRLLPFAAAALLGAALLPAAASAGTLTYSGTTVTYTAAPGEENFLTVNWGNGSGGPAPPVFTDHVTITPGAGCEESYSSAFHCPAAGAHPTVIVHLGDRDDVADSSNAQAAGNHVELYGEDGKDHLTSVAGGDLLDGGPGDDILEPDDGDEGPGDVVRGGDGTDDLQLAGTLVASLTATLDGVADDGPPGENDNYAADIENVYGSHTAANTIVGTDGPNIIRGGILADNLSGLGGDDRIEASEGNDRLDGGDGNDRLEGYSGDDVLIGGPGIDSMDGDGLGAWGQVVAGNDRIEARDGNAESINCGLATDTAILDATDTVPTDATTACEIIDRGVATPPPGPVPPLPGPAPKVAAVKSSSLRYARGRIAVRVACPAGATATCRGTVRVRAKRGKKTVTVASAAYVVKVGKTATARLKPTKAGKSLLRRARKMKVSVELTPRGAKKAAAKRAVTLRR